MLDAGESQPINMNLSKSLNNLSYLHQVIMKFYQIFKLSSQDLDLQLSESMFV